MRGLGEFEGKKELKGTDVRESGGGKGKEGWTRDAGDAAA